MHFITRKHLSRRLFLRGAGTALALPLLDSMTPALAAQPAPVRRLACLYIPHGKTMDKWTPATTGADFEFTEILKPLEPLRQHLVVVSGLGLPAALGGDASADGNHTRSSACFLTGAQPATGAQPRLGTSLDQVAAAHVGRSRPLPSMELGIEDGSLSCGTGLSCAYRNTLSWLNETTPLPVENNPRAVFERLFGDGTTPAQRAERRARAASLLDALGDQIRALDAGLPAMDRQRLERYLDDVREIERRIEIAGARPSGNLEAPVGVPDSFDAHVKLQMDLLVLAFQSDATRVATLLLAKEVSNAVFPACGLRDSFHVLSHHSNSRANKDKFAIMNRYHISLFGYLLQKLKDTPDGGGSLLDHSLLLYGSGISDGNDHNHDPLPILVAGGADGRVRGNRHIAVPHGTPLSNLQLSLLHKLDVPAERFGDSTGEVAV